MWASAWDFQQCGMCYKQSHRSACAYAQSDYVLQAKPQISLRICAVWSEPLLVAWVFYDFQATDWTSFGVSKLKMRLQRLVRVYICQNATVLETSCHGSYSIAYCLAWRFTCTFRDRVNRGQALSFSDVRKQVKNVLVYKALSKSNFVWIYVWHKFREIFILLWFA